MEIIKYVTNDGYIILSPEGNTYVGRSANDILMIFINKGIKGYENEKDILDFAVKHDRLKIEAL